MNISIAIVSQTLPAFINVFVSPILKTESLFGFYIFIFLFCSLLEFFSSVLCSAFIFIHFFFSPLASLSNDVKVKLIVASKLSLSHSRRLFIRIMYYCVLYCHSEWNENLRHQRESPEMQ